MGIMGENEHMNGLYDVVTGGSSRHVIQQQHR